MSTKKIDISTKEVDKIIQGFKKQRFIPYPCGMTLIEIYRFDRHMFQISLMSLAIRIGKHCHTRRYLFHFDWQKGGWIELDLLFIHVIPFKIKK